MTRTPPFTKRSPDRLVEGGAEQLTAVLTEADARHSFAVGPFKPPQTLAALDLPHLNAHGSRSVNAAQHNWTPSSVTENTSADLDLSVLGSGGQHLRVPAEAHAQHGVVHHHEVVLSLILQILGTNKAFLITRAPETPPSPPPDPHLYLSDFPSGEVPHLDEAINRTSDQILTIRGESGTLHMRFLSKLFRGGRNRHVRTRPGSPLGAVRQPIGHKNLDLSAELGGEALLLHVFDGSFAPEQVDRGSWWEETLMLLPLQRLEDKTGRAGQSRPCSASLAFHLSPSPT